MELRITTRTRAFQIRGPVDNDSNQCLQRGERIIDYEVVVHGDSEHLSPEGFILDRNAIPAYFHETYARGVDVLPSCEAMASRAAAEIAKLTQGRAHRVQATVGGATAIWSRPGYKGEVMADAPASGGITPDNFQERSPFDDLMAGLEAHIPKAQIRKAGGANA